MDTDKLIHADLSEAVIGASLKVLNTWKPGLDPKVAEDFTPTHVAQIVGYLAIIRLRLALLLNFKHAELKWRRVVW